MHIDTTEVAAVAAAAGSGRFDVYATIHKALRMMMSHALVEAGRLDCADDDAVRRTCADLARLADFCTSHLVHENAFIHPAIEAAAPGASARIEGEHVQHERDIADLHRRIAELASAPASERAPAAHALYHALGLFVAHNLMHMHIEETAHNRVLWEHYDDAGIVDVHRRLVGHVPAAEMALAMRWMIPAMNPGERVATLAAMKADAPAAVFDATMALARETLDGAQWARLARALGHPANAAPALA